LQAFAIPVAGIEAGGGASAVDAAEPAGFEQAAAVDVDPVRVRPRVVEPVVLVERRLLGFRRRS
jgi:hypothetical protein